MLSGMVQTKKGKRPLNTRERKVIKELASGKSPIKALVSAGYSPYTAARNAAKKVLQLQVPIQALMDKEGISDKRLLKVLNQGLDSTKCISAIGDANGKSTDFVEVPDYSVRHRYLETGLKLRGHLKTQDNTSLTQNNFLQININEPKRMTPINDVVLDEEKV